MTKNAHNLITQIATQPRSKEDAIKARDKFLAAFRVPSVKTGGAKWSIDKAMETLGFTFVPFSSFEGTIEDECRAWSRHRSDGKGHSQIGVRDNCPFRQHVIIHEMAHQVLEHWRDGLSILAQIIMGEEAYLLHKASHEIEAETTAHFISQIIGDEKGWDDDSLSYLLNMFMYITQEPKVRQATMQAAIVTIVNAGLVVAQPVKAPAKTQKKGALKNAA